MTCPVCESMCLFNRGATSFEHVSGGAAFGVEFVCCKCGCEFIYHQTKEERYAECQADSSGSCGCDV